MGIFYSTKVGYFIVDVMLMIFLVESGNDLFNGDFKKYNDKVHYCNQNDYFRVLL